MTLNERMNEDYITAFKARASERVEALRMLKSAIKNEEINLGHSLTDSEVIAVLTREAKRRKEAIDQYTSAGRNELATKEANELEIIEEYLPKGMSEAELEAIVSEIITETGATTKTDMGKVMGALKQKLENPADISKAAGLVQQKLV